MGDEELKGRALADDDNKEDEENENEKIEEEMVIPVTVTFPRSSRKLPPIPPLKAEVEDKGASSQTMWQVYALGGFLIVRWLWARWQERRRARGRNEGDDNNDLDESANHRPDL